MRLREGQGRSRARLPVVADAIADGRRPRRLKKPSEHAPSPVKEPDAAKHPDQAPPPRNVVTAGTCLDLLRLLEIIDEREAREARCHDFRTGRFARDTSPATT